MGHFWGFQADEASMEKQRHLTKEINMREQHPVTISLYPNLLCLAPYSESDEQFMYYRAKILHIRDSSAEVVNGFQQYPFIMNSLDVTLLVVN